MLDGTDCGSAYIAARREVGLCIDIGWEERQRDGREKVEGQDRRKTGERRGEAV